MSSEEVTLLKGLERQVSISASAIMVAYLSTESISVNLPSPNLAKVSTLCTICPTRLNICQAIHRAPSQASESGYCTSRTRWNFEYASWFVHSAGYTDPGILINLLFILFLYPLLHIPANTTDPSTLPLFHNLSSANDAKPDDPYGPLIKCLGLQDEFVLLESLRIMALLIS